MEKTVNLFASQRLIELLSNIEHKISYDLSESIRYRQYVRVSYLDFGSTNDTISFISSNKLDEIQKNHNNWAELVWKEKRSEMKVGKLIKLLFGQVYPINHPKGEPIPKPRNDIESFVNKFKAEREKNVNYNRFELIKGKDFHYWYSQDNYSRFVHDETTLGRSCLRYNKSSKFLKMYSENPEIFSLLILKDDANKLRGRAIVWNLHEPKGRIYMDRIYSVNDFDVELFKNYAKERGWLYKERQTYGWENNIVDSKDGKVYSWNDMLLSCTLKKSPGNHYKYYPYLDTLSIYNRETKVLCNDGELRQNKPYFVLNDYQGSYNVEFDDTERVFSIIYDERISRDDATYTEIDQSWVYSHDAVYVSNTGGLYAYINSRKIAKSTILHSTKYFLKENCVYSDYLRTYVFSESARTAYLDEERKEKVIIHKKLIGRDFEERKDGTIVKKNQEELEELEKSKSSNLFDTYSQDRLYEILDHTRSEQEPDEVNTRLTYDIENNYLNSVYTVSWIHDIISSNNTSSEDNTDSTESNDDGR